MTVPDDDDIRSICSEWLTRQIEKMTDDLNDLRAEALTDWLTDRLTEWLIGFQTDFEWFKGRSTDWLADWPADWVTDWLINGLWEGIQK